MAGKGGALAGLDLSLRLTPEQEAARLAAAQARLLHLRLVLGGVRILAMVPAGCPSPSALSYAAWESGSVV